MTRRHENLAAWLWLAALACLTTWATTLGWQALTEGYGRVAVPTLLLGVPILVGGAALRWWGVPPGLVALGQLLALAMLWLGVTTGSVVPVEETRSAAVAAWTDALATARQYAPPITSAAAPVTPLLLALALALMWVVENLVSRFRATSAAGVALLVAYVVPAAIAGQGVSWWVFALSASLFLATLYRQHGLQIAEWGRVPSEGSGRYGSNHEATTLAATFVGAVAVVAGLMVPGSLPSPELSFFDGAGPGNGRVTVQNPVADLRRDLKRPDDVPLLDVVASDDTVPSYLRLSVLTRFSEGAWRPGDRSIPAEQTATGELPPLDGVAPGVAREETDYSVAVTDLFSSRWLPLADQTSRVEAGEEWFYDLSTRDVMAADEGDSTAGLAYDFTGVRLDLDPAKLDATTSARNEVRPIFLEVPSSVPPTVARLADEVTAGLPTRFQKAQRLQQWFREDGGFRYDLRAVESSGASATDIVAFLDEETGRVGYCEQFAASMAIMARALDIPARVAVGFLRPERIGPRTWRYSAWDMHAWPELYFPDAGWVRFEPTPADRAVNVPGYSTADLSSVPTSTIAPTQAPPTEDVPTRGARPDGATDDTDSSSGDDAALPVWLTRTLWGALAGIVVLGLALLPRWWRERLRRRRSGAGPEEVWAELRARAVDLGLGWPAGRSPARVSQALEVHLARPVARAQRLERPRRGRAEAPRAAQSLDRIRDAVERQRYAPSSTAARPDLAEDLAVVAEALGAGVTPGQERRARWLPRSVFGLGRAHGSARGPAPVRGDRLA